MKKILFSSIIAVSILLSGCGSVLSVLNPEKELSLKVAIARGDGTLLPVTHTKFTFNNYSYSQLLQSAIKSTGAGNPQRYFSATEKQAWEDKVLTVFKDTHAKAELENKPVSVTTDLSGSTNLKLGVGDWYVSGLFSNSVSTVFWDDVLIHVDSNLAKIELSNDTITKDIPYKLTGD